MVHRDAEKTAGLANSAVDILNNTYIIRANIRGNDLWYELTHDRLVEPIITANQRWLAAYHNPLAAAHNVWLAAGRDPKKLLKGTQLATTDANKTWLYDAQNGSSIAASLTGAFAGFNPDGTQLATESNSLILLWDTFVTKAPASVDDLLAQGLKRVRRTPTPAGLTPEERAEFGLD